MLATGWRPTKQPHTINHWSANISTPLVRPAAAAVPRRRRMRTSTSSGSELRRSSPAAAEGFVHLAAIAPPLCSISGEGFGFCLLPTGYLSTGRFSRTGLFGLWIPQIGLFGLWIPRIGLERHFWASLFGFLNEIPKPKWRPASRFLPRPGLKTGMGAVTVKPKMRKLLTQLRVLNPLKKINSSQMSLKYVHVQLETSCPHLRTLLV